MKWLRQSAIGLVRRTLVEGLDLIDSIPATLLRREVRSSSSNCLISKLRITSEDSAFRMRAREYAPPDYVAREASSGV